MDSNNKYIHATRQWTKETHSEAERHDETALNLAVRWPFRREPARGSPSSFMSSSNDASPFCYVKVNCLQNSTLCCDHRTG